MTLAPARTAEGSSPPIGSAGAFDLLIEGARAGAVGLLRSSCGRKIELPVGRWLSAPQTEEEAVLDRTVAPVLDVGCGPGRHCEALARRGVDVLGIDSSPNAVLQARRRGARVLQGSVFDPIPDEGRWGSALLLDGNVGIGGRPDLLLSRLRRIVRPGGRVLAEVEPPGVAGGSLEVVVEEGGRASGAPFPWAIVGADEMDDIAACAGFTLAELWCDSGRWFARLEACTGEGAPLP